MSIRRKLLLGACFGSFLTFGQVRDAWATIYYVDGLNGSDSHTGTSSGVAWKTPAYASWHANAGDTICIMDTANYGPLALNNPSSNLPHHGTSSNHITYQGCNASGVFIGGTTNADGTFNDWAPTAKRPIFYDNGNTTVTLQIKGNNDATNSPMYLDFKWLSFQGTSVPNSSENGKQLSSVYINTSSHLGFYHDEIAYASAEGLGTEAAQFITIDHSDVHDNAHYVEAGGNICTYSSGISILRTYDWDNVTNGNTQISSGYTEVITNNRIYNNYNDASTGSKSYCTIGGWPPTDGEGVILDRNDGSCQSGLGCPSADPGGGSALPRYYGKILIAGNMAYHNGGPGIHSYLSTGPVDILNNVAFNNNYLNTNAGSNPGDINILSYGGSGSNIGVVSGSIVRVIGNTVWNNGQTLYNPSGLTGTVNNKGPRYCFADTQQQTGASHIWKNNVCFDDTANNAGTPTSGWHVSNFSQSGGSAPTLSGTKLGDPLFASPGAQSAAGSVGADFRVQPASPALGFVMANSTEVQTPDVLGVTRTYSNDTAGAYQNYVGGGGCTTGCTTGSGTTSGGTASGSPPPVIDPCLGTGCGTNNGNGSIGPGGAGYGGKRVLFLRPICLTP